MKVRIILILSVFVLCTQHAVAQWEPNGLPVCVSPGNQSYPMIISDGAGGAIIVWNDERDASRKFFAQRVNAHGVALWSADGIPVCDTTQHLVNLCSVISDGAGGAIITWTYTPAFKEDDIYAQRIGSNGAAIWTEDGISVCTEKEPQKKPQTTTDGANGAIIAWEDSRYGAQDTYAQRVSAYGSRLWATEGVPISLAGGCARMHAITSDDSGGAIVAWADSRSGNWDIYAQRVDPNGIVLWTLNGVAVCTASGLQTDPALVPDGVNGAILIWDDERGGNHDVYAQRIDAGGTCLWAPDGVAVCAAANEQEDAKITSDGLGGAVIVWQDDRSANRDIYAQRINANGLLLWQAEGQEVCVAPQDQSVPQITSDGSAGAIITWTDHRNGNNDVYTQRIGASGTPLWLPGGVALTDEPADQQAQQITTDGAGGAIIVWHDARSGYYLDIYAQRLNAEGSLVATLLQSYSASHTTMGIEVTWSLSEAGSQMRFLVLRAGSSGSDYRELADPVIGQKGMTFTFVDKTVEPGGNYKYRVYVDDENGRRILFETDSIGIPAVPLTLYPNYPNPFNPTTIITYYIPEPREVHLDIFDVNGNHIRRLESGIRQPGKHTVYWDGRTIDGRLASAGVYFCRLSSCKRVLSRKMVLLR